MCEIFGRFINTPTLKPIEWRAILQKETWEQGVFEMSCVWSKKSDYDQETMQS